jgi:hypothetical protein
LNILNIFMSKIIKLNLFFLSYQRFEVVWWWRPWCISMKSWVQTLMNVWVNVYNVYIHWCIMYKYDIQNMYDGSEYLQNILFKRSNFFLLILNHGIYFCCNLPWRFYNPWPQKKKVLNVLHNDVAFQSTSLPWDLIYPCQIFLIINYLVQHVTTQNN